MSPAHYSLANLNLLKWTISHLRFLFVNWDLLRYSLFCQYPCCISTCHSRKICVIIFWHFLIAGFQPLTSFWIGSLSVVDPFGTGNFSVIGSFSVNDLFLHPRLSSRWTLLHKLLLGHWLFYNGSFSVIGSFSNNIPFLHQLFSHWPLRHK